MTVVGRLQPFVAVTQSNALTMPAKGNFRPETASRNGLGEGPFTDQKADDRRGAVPLSVGRWYDFPKFGGNLGNVG